MNTALAPSSLPAGLLKLADYRAVVLLLEEGNVRRAARCFGTTRPALSMRLQRLEARMEQALFVRAPEGLRATAASEMLDGHARSVLIGSAGACHARNRPAGNLAPPDGGGPGRGPGARLGGRD